jgi:hypothetical protein
MALRNLIWRLRNRLIVAYLFIAVVPSLLILVLMLVVYALVGQIAVYMVQKDLDSRMVLRFGRDLTRAPAQSEWRCSVLSPACSGLSVFEILATGEQQFDILGHQIVGAAGPWRNASGLVTKRDGDTEACLLGARRQGGNEVTILAPSLANC